MTVTIRRAEPSDCMAVLTLRQHLLAHEKSVTGSNGTVPKEEKFILLHDILGALLDPSSFMALAVDGTKPVGMLLLQQGNIIGAFQDRGVMVTWLYVEPDYMNTNVFVALHQAAWGAIRRDRSVTIQAMVRAGNTEMLEGAAKLGYTQVAHVLERKHERTDERPTSGEPLHNEGGRHPQGSGAAVPT